MKNSQSTATQPESTAPLDAAAPTVETFEQLQSELAAANAKISQLAAAKEVADADENIIADKMLKGLTRQQAQAVIKRQRAFDTSDYGRMVAARHAARQCA